MSENGTETSESSVEFVSFPDDVQDRIKLHFPNYEDGLFQSVPAGFVTSSGIAQNFQQLFNFPGRPDDHWVVTFPKCGTTWMQELVWLLMNNCDYEVAKKSLDVRVPFFEMPFLVPSKTKNHMMETEAKMEFDFDFNDLEKMPSPRVLKSHFMLSLLPRNTLDTCKVVYVARNPKDVIVSFYYHHQLIFFHNFNGDLEAFAEYFMRNEVLFAPYFGHILEAWNLRNHPNLLFLFYEDLKRDLRGQIEKVSHFLNKSLTDDQLTRLTEHLHIDNFSKNDAVNKEPLKKAGYMHNQGRFIRKGKTGDWKNKFSPELNTRIDQWIEKNLEGTDLKFITELDQQD